MVLAASGGRIEPEARSIKLAVSRRLVSRDVLQKLFTNQARKRDPVWLGRLARRFDHIARVTHVKTTDAAALAVVDRG